MQISSFKAFVYDGCMIWGTKSIYIERPLINNSVAISRSNSISKLHSLHYFYGQTWSYFLWLLLKQTYETSQFPFREFKCHRSKANFLGRPLLVYTVCKYVYDVQKLREAARVFREKPASLSGNCVDILEVLSSLSLQESYSCHS